VLTTLLAYGQLVLGSKLRHVPTDSRPGDFQQALVFHLALALALVVHIGLLALAVFRTQRGESSLTRPAGALVGLVLLEICLGASTWVTKYGMPGWLGGWGFAAAYTVAADSRSQAWITTAHVATGSLILATSVLISLRSLRYAWNTPRAIAPGGMRMAEVAL
jgi:heme a synthase